MSGAAFWTHPEGFLGLHVGSCWGHVGSRWRQVASLWLSCAGSMLLAAFWTHPEGVLGLHVGSCWLMLGLCWLKVAPSWLQDGSRSLYVGSSWPQDGQEGPQRPPKYSKMRPKWVQDGFQIDIFWLHGGFFEICFRTVGFQRFYCFSGAGKASILTNVGSKIP